MSMIYIDLCIFTFFKRHCLSDRNQIVQLNYHENRQRKKVKCFLLRLFFFSILSISQRNSVDGNHFAVGKVFFPSEALSACDNLTFANVCVWWNFPRSYHLNVVFILLNCFFWREKKKTFIFGSNLSFYAYLFFSTRKRHKVITKSLKLMRFEVENGT